MLWHGAKRGGVVIGRMLVCPAWPMTMRRTARGWKCRLAGRCLRGGLREPFRGLPLFVAELSGGL
eukprot:9680139-Prorocentrum_lima.AAC.1